MDHNDVRKGVTQAFANYEFGPILFGEILIISIIIGAMYQSWWIFGGLFVFLNFGLHIKFLNMLIVGVLTFIWGWIGYGIGSLFDSTAASIVLGIFGLLSGYGAHSIGLQWARDMAE